MALNHEELLVLKAELDNDPLGRGYTAMGPQFVAEDLKLGYRSRIRSAMSSSEVFQAVDKTEFLALADGHQGLIMNIMAFGSINPQGREADIFIQVFGAQSQTVQQLASDRQEPVSRAIELGIGGVRAGDVEVARDLV